MAADDQPAQGDLLRPLPATTARVIRFSAEIAETQPERPDYLYSVLCQVGLPRSRTTATKFARNNGSASLLVEAGSLWNGKEWVEQPLPYGTRPRLALVYVSSEAVRTRSPTVELGGSVRDFLLRLGVDTSGRKYATFNNKSLRWLVRSRNHFLEAATSALLSDSTKHSASRIIAVWLSGGSLRQTERNRLGDKSSSLSGQ